MYSQYSVYKLEGGGLVINGIMIAAYYNMFVIIMAIFMLMGGVLLTALAYRPKEMGEEWWEWTERFYRSKNTRIVGPLLIVISVLLNIAAMVYCLLKRHVRRMTRLEDEEGSADHSEGGSWQADRECLLLPHSDIACFPDGSPRYSLVINFKSLILYSRFPTKSLQQDMKGMETGELDEHK